MKNLFGGLVTLALLGIASISALTMNSCRNNTLTQWDTLVVHDTIHCPDDSSTWIGRSSGTTENLVIGTFQGSTGFVGGVHGVVLKTNNAGTTWQTAASAPVFNSSYGPGAIYGLSFADPASLFAVGEQRMIVKSNDAGSTWNSMDASNVPFSDLIRSLCFTSSGTGFIGTSDAYAAPSGTICKTTDSGLTWNPVFTTSGGIYNIDFNGSNGVAQGRFGVNYWTNDNGNSWNAGSADVPNSILYRSAFTSSTTGFAVALENETSGYILQTNDAGHSWHTIKSVPYGLQGIATNGHGRITAVGYAGAIYESTDGGATWTHSTAGTNRWIDIRYPNQTRAVIVGENGRIFTRDK